MTKTTKKVKWLSLTLITLCMFACGGENTSSAAQSNTSATSSSQKVNASSYKDIEEVSYSAEKKSSTSKGSADESDISGDISSGGGSKKSDASSTSDIYDCNWPADVVDEMYAHLNHNILPYINLGKYPFADMHEPDYSDSETYLEIAGSNDFDASTLDTAKTTYETAGWTCTKSSSKLTATLASENLKIIYLADEGGFSMIKAYYNEPFDATAATDWNDDVKTNGFDYYLSGEEIPYVYLATVSPTVKAADSYYPHTFYICGGKWNSQILTLFANAYTAAGWTVTSSTGSSYNYIHGKSLSGSCKTATGSTTNFAFEITCGQDSYGTAWLIVYYTEAFNPSMASGDWTQDVYDAMDLYVDSHYIPYFYIGTNAPSTYHSSYSYYYDYDLQIQGSGTWDSQVVTLATTAFAADNADGSSWTYSTYTDTDSYYGTSTTHYVWKKNFSDGHMVSCDMYKDDDYGVMLELALDNAWLPETFTDWPSDVETNFNTYLDGHILTPIYLNTNTPTSSWNSTYKCLQITGGEYKTDVTTNFKTVLQNDTTDGANWTFSTEYISYSYYSSSEWESYQTINVAKTTLDDGCTITLKIGEAYNSSYYGTGNALLECYIHMPFVVPDDATDWSDDVKNAFDTYTDSHYLPFFYIGSKTPTIYTGAWSSAKQIELRAGAAVEWDNQINVLAKAAFDADNADGVNWTTTLSTDGKTLKAEKLFADNCLLTVTVKYSSSYGPIVDIKVGEGFTPSTSTAWTEDVTDLVTADLDGHELPFVYLGTVAPTAKWNATTQALTITGGTYNSQVLDLAETAFSTSSDNWTVTKTTSNVTATVDFADGHRLQATVSNTSSKCTLVVYLKEAFMPELASDWTDDVKTEISTNFDNHSVPFVYLGTVNETAAYASSALTITGGEWDDQVIGLFNTAMTTAGWDVFDGNATTTRIATYDCGDGHTLKAVLKKTSSKAVMTVTMSDTYTKPDTAPTAWTDDINTFFDDNCDGHALPFFYNGCDAPATNVSSSGALQIRGTKGTFSDTMIDEAVAALTADSNDWDMTVSGDTNNYKTLTASTTFEDGCEMTVEVKRNTSYGCLINISFDEAFKVPTTYTDWSDDVKTAFTDNFGGHNLPLFYIGTETPTVYSGKASSGEIDLRGVKGVWDDAIVTWASDAFTADNADGVDWTLTPSTDSNGHAKLEASKVFDDMTITVTIQYSGTYGCLVKIVKA